MRYLVFTAKHHAGFSMFDSAVTDYDIMSTLYGKDLLKLTRTKEAYHDNDYSPSRVGMPDGVSCRARAVRFGGRRAGDHRADRCEGRAGRPARLRPRTVRSGLVVDPLFA